MVEHKFKIGQMVLFQPRDHTIDASRKSPYQITARLPAVGSEFHYRIRATHEQHERAAIESELRLATTR